MRPYRPYSNISWDIGPVVTGAISIVRLKTKVSVITIQKSKRSFADDSRTFVTLRPAAAANSTTALARLSKSSSTFAKFLSECVRFNQDTCAKNCGDQNLVQYNPGNQGSKPGSASCTESPPAVVSASSG